MKPRRAVAPLVLGGLLIGLPAAPAFAAETTTAAAPAPDTTVSTKLPVFGVGISIDVSLDAAGHLTTVNVLGDGGGPPPADIVATSAGPHKVSLVNTTTGTEVQIQTSTHKIQTKMESSSLADLLGPGTWTGDLFGDGTSVTVDYEIRDNDGTPIITIVKVDGGAFTMEESSDIEGDEIEVEVKLAITSTTTGAEGTVKIQVEVEEDDGRTEAELKISARGATLFDDDRDDDHVDGVDAPALNVPVDDSYDADHDHDDDDHDDHDDDDNRHDQDDDDDEDRHDDHHQGNKKHDDDD